SILSRTRVLPKCGTQQPAGPINTSVPVAPPLPIGTIVDEKYKIEPLIEETALAPCTAHAISARTYPLY
ncbi:MAG: hypothetical protein FWD57_14940, partial [Polyangiaceae bacterium]|nr:hypothetical protein [Polyangiaceae bacterium]